MPESRRRKVYKARKRPRVQSSNSVSNASQSSSPYKWNGIRDWRIGVAILVAAVVIGGVVYVITRNNKPPQTAYELTTPSGLKIHDEKVGDGPSPKMGQMVRVHYIGRFENGKEFNNSHKVNNGEPAEFRLGGVIQGWNEALQSMKVGGKRTIFVPSKLAYGPAGKPPDIPPNANLEFDIELLGIK